MNKKIVLVVPIICVFLIGCSTANMEKTNLKALEIELENMKVINDSNAELILKLNERLEVLEVQNFELREELNNQNNTISTLMKSSDIADRFILSYLNNDIKAMELLTVDSLEFTEDYISYKVEDEIINLDIVKGLETYRLNSFGNHEGRMFYQYLVYKEPYEGIESGFFINLGVELIDGLWQVNSIDFDV